MTSLSEKTINNALTRSNSAEITSFARPDTTAAVSIANYTTLTKNGFIHFSTPTITNSESSLFIDNYRVYRMSCAGSTSVQNTAFLPVYKGQVVSFVNITVDFLPAFEGVS